MILDFKRLSKSVSVCNSQQRRRNTIHSPKSSKVIFFRQSNIELEKITIGAIRLLTKFCHEELDAKILFRRENSVAKIIYYGYEPLPHTLYEYI